MPIRTLNRPSLPSRPVKPLARNPALDFRGDALGAPVSFSAEIDSLTVGEVKPFDTATLQPGFRTPYWIDEIRFTVTLAAARSAIGAHYPWTGLASYLMVKFQTGSYSFSREFMPIGLLAPRWARGETGMMEGGLGTYDGSEVPIERTFAYVRWPLPKPLFMPAGDAIQCSMLAYPYDLLKALGSMNLIEKVSVTYVGRLAAPGTPPAPVRHVPWLAWFQKTNAVGRDTIHAQTNDQFRNPFSDKPLYVQRFTMRQVLERTANEGSWPGTMFDVTSGFGQLNGADLTAAYDEVRLYDSLGYAIVPDYTPINDVFDGTRCAWTFGRTLGPREQFDLQLRTTGTATIPPEDPPYWTQIGLVGFREENS